jgi:hypothetical protein
MMKKLAKSLLWGAIFLLGVGIALAQEAHIVHYDADANASVKRPDFKGAAIAIDFGGTAAINAKVLFMKLGARDFVEGQNPCVVGQNVICVRISVGKPQQFSSSGQIGGYGSGGYSGGGSFSGNLYPVTLDVFLVKYDKDDGGHRPTIELGQAMCLTPAGSGTEYSSSYGRNGSGGSYTSTSTSSLDATVGNAVRQDLNRLLSRSAFSQFLAWGTYAKWLPGAGNAVKEAFKQ